MRHHRPLTGVSRALWAHVSPGVSDGVSPKIVVSDGVSGRVSRGPFRPRAPECPKSVPRVSPDCPGHLFDTPGTLPGHLLDTPEAGARRTLGTPPGHSVRHPDFRGHSIGHSRGHSGPEGPTDSCRGPTMSQEESQRKKTKLLTRGRDTRPGPLAS